MELFLVYAQFSQNGTKPRSKVNQVDLLPSLPISAPNILQKKLNGLWENKFKRYNYFLKEGFHFKNLIFLVFLLSKSSTMSKSTSFYFEGSMISETQGARCTYLVILNQFMLIDSSHILPIIVSKISISFTIFGTKLSRLLSNKLQQKYNFEVSFSQWGTLTNVIVIES